jgi:hypothetical protein
MVDAVGTAPRQHVCAEQKRQAMRLLEMLTDRFGVFEALAHSTIKLNRCTSADELSMDPQVAEAVLELPTTCAPPAPPPAPGPRPTAWCPRAAGMTPEGKQ